MLQTGHALDSNPTQAVISIIKSLQIREQCKEKEKSRQYKPQPPPSSSSQSATP